MNAILPADIVAELENAIVGCPPDRRVRMLWRTTDLLLAGRDRFQEQEVGALDEVLIRLAERLEPAALAQLSTTLADLKLAPRETLRRLAFHDDPAVAAPVLLTSREISARDLEAIGSSRGEQHLLAIARRHRVDQDLTDILLKRGGKTVHLALVKNPGAQFSEAGYAILVGKVERDSELEKALALRPGVPDAILRGILGAAKKVQAPSLDHVPSKARNPIDPSARPSAQTSDTKVRRAIDYSEARQEIIALNRTGKLNDSTVNRFAIRGEKAKLIAALSVLSGAPTEIIESMMADTDCEALVMACRASRLNWQTTLSILSNRGTTRLTHRDREQAQQLFDTLHLSTSQWSVRWGELAARAGAVSTDDRVAKSGGVR